MIENRIYESMHEQLRHIPTDFTRYKHDDINWNTRMLGITGPRGVGKSTMVLQHIKKSTTGKRLYISADNIYFASHTLADFADDFVKEGGTHLYIDEIHKYPGWSRELKQVYDTHPALHVVFTGSSVLDIRRGEADLSRRALMYSMQGLSFREYLQLFHNVQCTPYSLDDILAHKVEIPGVEHPLPLFHDYLRQGYYPFSIEGDFNQKLTQVVAQTMEVDIPQYADMRASTARKLRQMLSILCTLAPYKPSMENLSAEIGASKNSIPDYLTYMERAGLIGLLRDDTAGMRNLGKLEKVYMDNTNLMYALSESPNTGSVRETFFYNQMRECHLVRASRVSDFLVEGYTFEIGGRKKGKQQIENVPHGIVVKDDIETGHDIIVPLWCFGLTY